MSSHKDDRSLPRREENLIQRTDASNSDEKDFLAKFSTMDLKDSDERKEGNSTNSKPLVPEMQKVNDIINKPLDEKTKKSIEVESEPESTQNTPKQDKNVKKITRLPQMVSIQWLNLNRVSDSNKTKTSDDLSRIIESIVENHNEKIKDKNAKRDNQEAKVEDKEAEFDNEEIEPEDDKIYYQQEITDFEVNPEDTNCYQLKIYSCLRARKTCLSEIFVANPEYTQNYSFILFFYREDPPRIISATSGTAWRIVNPYVDYTFPKKIATKVGDPNKIKEIVVKCSIFGECSKKTLHCPDKLVLYGTSCLYDLVSSLKCAIKTDSSLYHLLYKIKFPSRSSLLNQPKTNSPYPPSPAKKRSKVFNIAINNGGVRIQENLHPKNYKEIVQLFSDMMDKNELNIERKNSGFGFLQFFQHLQLPKMKLDECLIEEIFQKYQEKQEPFVSVICDKNIDDFINSEKFEMCLYPENKYEELRSNPPHIEEILNKIVEKMKNKTDITEFKQSMTSAQLRFANKSNQTSYIYVPLLDCIEGGYRDSDDKSYFRIGNSWQAINYDHMALLQQDFNRVYRNALISRKSEGWLPVAWEICPPQTLTAKLLEERLNGKALGKCKEIIDSLLRYQVSYIHETNIEENKLVGQILENNEIISKNKDLIEKILVESKKPSEVINRVREKFVEEDANIILNELKKKRNVIEERKNQKKNIYHVLNPLPNLLKQILERKNYGIEVQNVVIELLNELQIYKNSGRNFEEWRYNSTYLNKNNYLVFDKILPDGIEPCDILKYTDNEVYLYHVKKDLGQRTREASSQILNAAKFIQTALSIYKPDNNNNYLENLWTSAEKMDKDYANQLALFDKKKFIDIFHNRKLIFVYAYCPKPGQDYPDGIRSALKEVKEPAAKERLIDVLKKLMYLDSYEQFTHRFISAKKTDFILDGEFQKHSANVFDKLRKFYNFSRSTIAKLEITRLASQVQALGFEFGICEIITE